jgi:phytanoyl-CoA hydroxylase
METQKIKHFYDEHGYIAIKDFLDEKETTALVVETDRFVKTVVPTLPHEIVYYENKEDSSTLKQIQHIDQHDEYFKKIAGSSKVVNLAELLLGGKAVLKNMQYFNKVPRIGKETPAHQDGFYFKIKPQFALTMWLSLDYADSQNGAVYYIPGSHKKGMRQHGKTSVLGFSQGVTDWSDDDSKAEVPMAAKPGDLLVHHSMTIHRANPNQSNRHRKSIGFIFYREDVRIDEEAHAAYQKELNETLKKQGKI